MVCAFSRDVYEWNSINGPMVGEKLLENGKGC